jgi:hypothetical protein
MNNFKDFQIGKTTDLIGKPIKEKNGESRMKEWRK